MKYITIPFISGSFFPKGKTTQFKIRDNGISFGESKFRNRGILINTDDGDLLLLVQYPRYDLGKIQLEVEKYFGLAVEADPGTDTQAQALKGGTAPEAAVPLITEPEDPAEHALNVVNVEMLKQIRSWGYSSLLLGVVHFAASGYLSPSWGVILVIVGLLSFFFKASSMFMVYAVSLLWVGVSNIISASLGGWTLFGVYQIYLAYRVYRKYRLFQTNEQALLEIDGKNQAYQKSEKWFPRLSLLFGGGSLVSCLGFWGTIIGMAIIGYGIEKYNLIFDITADILFGFGMLGFSISLASLFSKYQKKWMAWVGLVCSVLHMGIDLFMVFFL